MAAERGVWRRELQDAAIPNFSREAMQREEQTLSAGNASRDFWPSLARLARCCCVGRPARERRGVGRPRLSPDFCLTLPWRCGKAGT